MIKVDMYDVKLTGKSDIITSELALLLHAMRNEYPEILIKAMVAEDKLYEMKKGR